MAAGEKEQGSVLDVIKKRKSWRNYTDTPIEDDKIKRINGLLETLVQGPFGARCRFALVDAGAEGMGKIMGTYGMVRGAKYFIVGTVDKSGCNMEDFGYLFEKIILLATEMDLGTCWLGDTFNKNMFAGKIGLKADELLPAVSPIGHASEKKNLLGQAASMIAGSKNRKNWEELFFDGSFTAPLTRAAAGGYEVPLEMVRIGPSATNKQPWRIVRNGGAYHLYLQRTKRYAKEGSEIDLQRIDMGIAMCHLELAARALGLDGKWTNSAAPQIGPLPEDTTYVASWVG